MRNSMMSKLTVREGSAAEYCVLSPRRIHGRLAARSELKAGVYDEIVSARLDRQLADLGAPFEVYRSALTVSDPISAVLRVAARGSASPSRWLN
jgi:hypothetical protein